MPSLLNQANSRLTGGTKPLQVKLDSRKVMVSNEVPAGTPPFAREHILTATVSVSFWATDEDFYAARKEATLAINHAMYAGALHLISAIRSAAYSHDMGLIHELIDQLQKEVGL